MTAQLHRRSFLTLLGGAAAAWPLAAGAQQPKVPVIGLLNGISNATYADRIAAIRQGLREEGFVEGHNVAIEYQSAEGRYERLPELVADLVRRPVDVIVGIGTAAPAAAAKAATSTIPIVFNTGGDPVELGLVTSLNRPERNVTGISGNNNLVQKRLELMHELLPRGALVGYLGDSSLRKESVLEPKALEAAARTLGRQIIDFNGSSEDDIRSAFAAMKQQRVAGLIVSGDALFNSRREQIVALSAHHSIPTIYSNRDYVRAGGLMSYGAQTNDTYRWTGIYAGRILKGEKPGNLPVMLPTKYELAINNKTAKALGIEVPLSLLIRVDEVIE